MMKQKERIMNPNSRHIIPLLPKNGVGVEIGVWRGSSSALFLNTTPQKLYLVDPWSLEPYKGESFEEFKSRYVGMVGSESEEVFSQYYSNVYESVVKEFGKLPNVKIERMESDDWFLENQDLELDWAYIDGNHSEEQCYKDLMNAYHMLKIDGVLSGDDYDPNDKPGRKNYGVHCAVKRFMEETGLQLEYAKFSQFAFRK